MDLTDGTSSSNARSDRKEDLPDLGEEGVSFQYLKTFKDSNDPDSEAKQAWVLELYAIADGHAAQTRRPTDAERRPMRAALRHAQRVLPLRVNRLGHAAALAALEDVHCIERVRAEIAKKRTWFTIALREAGFAVWDSSTNFVAVQLVDPAVVRRMLLDVHGIAVRDTRDMGYPRHLRNR